MSDGAVLEDLASAPELSVGGEGSFRTGLFLRVSRRPRNYPSGAKERVGWGWLRLWGVAGAPSVYRFSRGDALLSPELTVRADGGAVDWYAPRSVTYSRCGGIKVPPATTRSPLGERLMRSPSVLSPKHRPLKKSRRPPKTYPLIASLGGSFRGSAHKSLT